MSQIGDEAVPVGVAEIKKLLYKSNFRQLFPKLKEEIRQFLQNPGCKCNKPLYHTLLGQREKLEQYFGKPIQLLAKAPSKPQETNIRVINTNKDLLEKELRDLPAGHKYITMARYEDEITVVVQLLS